MTCHLYPFKLNTMDTLVVHFWALLRGCCHENTHTHKTAWESIRPSFELLFGTEQVERADKHIESGVDPYFKVPEHIARRYLLEAEWDREKAVPGPFDMHRDDCG